MSVAYPFAPVSRDSAGGAEQVLFALDSALVRAGARSVVVACGGSRINGTLVETEDFCTAREIDGLARRRAWSAHRKAIAFAIAKYRPGLVHMHGLDFHRYLPRERVPVLATLHLPPAWYPSTVFSLKGRPDVFCLNCVSASQQRGCPGLACIENGVPVDELSIRLTKRDFVLWMGRVCPEKGCHTAIEAARLAGIKHLLLAGSVFPYRSHQDYFKNEVLPRLDGSGYRFIGPAGFERKRRLLTAARAVLLPGTAPETSSLIAMEALACGTPVIAFPSGALPEIVEHGHTGYIVKDVNEMAHAIGITGRINPEDCRAAARAKFDAGRMAAGYFELYAKLMEL